MKLAEKILSNVVKTNESLYSSDRVNVELFDDLMVSLGYSCEIFKKRKPQRAMGTEEEEFEEFEDLELQATIKNLIKPDADMFVKNVTAKLVSLQNQE